MRGRIGRLLAWPFLALWSVVLVPVTMALYFIIWYGIVMALVGIVVWVPIMAVMWMFS